MESGFAFQDVHAGDEAFGDGVDVDYRLIGEGFAGSGVDELMDFHFDFTRGEVRDFEGLDAGVKFGPLAGPVGADAFFADDAAAFGGFGPVDGFRHEGERGVDVAAVEGGVGLRDYFVYVRQRPSRIG